MESKPRFFRGSIDVKALIMFLPIMFLGISADKATIKTTLTETWKQILDDWCKLSRYVKSWGHVSHGKLQEPVKFEE